MNVTSKMYLNELVKGFKNEGPTFSFFMVSYFYFAESLRSFLSETAVFFPPPGINIIQCFTHEPYKITFYSLHM